MQAWIARSHVLKPIVQNVTVFAAFDSIINISCPIPTQPLLHMVQHVLLIGLHHSTVVSIPLLCLLAFFHIPPLALPFLSLPYVHESWGQYYYLILRYKFHTRYIFTLFYFTKKSECCKDVRSRKSYCNHSTLSHICGNMSIFQDCKDQFERVAVFIFFRYPSRKKKFVDYAFSFCQTGKKRIRLSYFFTMCPRHWPLAASWGHN